MTPCSLEPDPTPRIGSGTSEHTSTSTIPEFERTSSIPTHFIPGYELLELVGEGGYGKVFKSRQYKLDRFVALKVIPTDSLSDSALASRFETEAVTLGKLHHPNVVQVYDFGQTDKHMYIAMELLDGKDLGAHLWKFGPFDERTTWLVIRQAAAGLAHAASQGVVHRDVKPANLFLTTDETGSDLSGRVPLVKVMDFGLALVKWGVDESGRRTAPGVAVGTPAYMAPEQHRGGPVDHRADIYALGTTTYHTLVGRAPFDGQTVWDVMARKLEHTPPPIPAGLEDSAKLIAAMMEPDATRRVQTYEALIDQIDRLPIFQTQKRQRPRRFFKLRGRPWIALAASAVVGATTLGLVVSRRGISERAVAPSPARYVSKGNQEALFDGASIERWSSVGQWGLDHDEEGTAVLSGSGLIRRPFTGYPDYRITIGLNVFNADAAEVHFGIPVNSPNGRRLVLRVTRADGAEFGTKAGEKERFVPLGPPVKFPSADWLSGRQPYLEVKIERAGGEWSTWFNGTPLGHTPDDRVPKINELGIRAENGRVRIDTVVLERVYTDPR